MKVYSKSNRIEALAGDVTNGASFGVDFQKPYRVEVTIQGTAPILFHRWNSDSVASKAKSAKGSDERKSDNIESFVYRNSNGEICIPGEYLRGSILGAAKFQQDPRSPRKSATDLFKAGVISLTPLASLGKKDWDCLDRRRVCIQKAGITRSRPCMTEGWTATFVVLVSLPEYISQDLLNSTIQSAGRLIGVGDFRPTFGRFNVTKFKILGN